MQTYAFGTSTVVEVAATAPSQLARFPFGAASDFVGLPTVCWRATLDRCTRCRRSERVAERIVFTSKRGTQESTVGLEIQIPHAPSDTFSRRREPDGPAHRRRPALLRRQRLVASAGSSYGAVNSEYGTEIDQYDRIRLLGGTATTWASYRRGSNAQRSH